MGSLWILLRVVLLSPLVASQGQFPAGFMFGAATASYQIEGAWNEDGKGENIWDHMLHEHPEFTADRNNGDVAADSYHKYLEDVAIAKDLNLTYYRFSLSWSRILPTGDTDVINQAGINYYNNLINALLDNGITPMVTLYHWDLPQNLQYLGGWPNEILVDYFAEYARVAFQSFGDRVKWWITFNEPAVTCSGYASYGAMAPSVPMPGIADYRAAHTILKAHAKAYHIYDEEFRPSQGGKIGITLNTDWNEPLSTAQQDIEAADRARDFYLGWFAHAIYSANGDYPATMRQRIDALSIQEGRPRSRLPSFTPDEILYIKGTSDFFGLNHYTSQLNGPSDFGDSGVSYNQDPSWPSSAAGWLKVVPWGFRKLVNWITANYPGYPIIVTENGYADYGGRDDNDRINYIRSYLNELAGAINEDGANVVGYTHWALIDNMEWNAGYTQKFGLTEVDFSSPDRTRTPKASYQIYKELASTGRVPTPQRVQEILAGKRNHKELPGTWKALASKIKDVINQNPTTEEILKIMQKLTLHPKTKKNFH